MKVEELRRRLEAGGRIWIETVGASMLPLIPSGSRVAMVKPGTLVPGQIYTFREPGGAGLITHHLVSVGSEGLLFRGDNCPAEHRVQAQDVLGWVVEVEFRGVRIDLRKFPWNVVNLVIGWLARRGGGRKALHILILVGQRLFYLGGRRKMIQVTLQTVLAIASSVAWANLGTDEDPEVLLTAGADATQINPTASWLWLKLDGQRTVGNLVGTLCGEFDVQPAQAEADITAFLSEALQKGWVKEVG